MPRAFAALASGTSLRIGEAGIISPRWDIVGIIKDFSMRLFKNFSVKPDITSRYISHFGNLEETRHKGFFIKTYKITSTWVHYQTVYKKSGVPKF